MLLKALNISFACLLGVALLFGLLSLIFPPPEAKPYSLVVTDHEGRFLQAFLARDGIWRLRTDPEEIPERLKEILIQREDRWFYYHPGVNPFALVRAAVQNVRSGRRISGGSTLTMQIARMLEPKERTLPNKIVEVFRALQLEWRYSKHELLEMYLSMVPLGGNIEGLKSASLLYYQTPPERLNIARLFDLILVPSNPNGLQPDKNADRLYAERLRQAAPWLRSGLLSRDDSITIAETPAAAERLPLQRHAPHFCLRVRDRAFGEAEIRSSLDLEIQKRVETLLSNHLRPWKMAGVRNGALLVVENRTGEIRAYAGSENFDDAGSSGQVDAVRALRSPGSTLKPFLVAMLMEGGDLTPQSRLLDTPYDAEGFLAENYDGTYAGMVSTADALRRSLNVPMVRLLKSSGIPRFLDFACAAGIGSLRGQERRLGLSLILGGCGVSLEELTGAYTAFANGGILQPLSFTASPLPRQTGEHRVFSSATAYMVTDILSGMDRPDVPNNFESTLHLPRVAFKTGTSYGRRDAWTIGYTRQYTVGVWIGNMDNSGNPDLTGGKTAAPLLIDILNSISAHSDRTIVPMPADVGLRYVCAESGLLPSPECRHQVEDLYSRSLTNLRVCDLCKEQLVSPDRRVSYCASCVEGHLHTAFSYVEYPPELLNFFAERGTAYASPPPHFRGCSRVFSGSGPSITSPSADMIYYVTSPGQKLALQAASGVDVRQQAWYADDRYLGRRRAGDLLLAELAPGKHRIACVDDRGRTAEVQFEVKLAMSIVHSTKGAP